MAVDKNIQRLEYKIDFLIEHLVDKKDVEKMEVPVHLQMKSPEMPHNVKAQMEGTLTAPTVAAATLAEEGLNPATTTPPSVAPAQETEEQKKMRLQTEANLQKQAQMGRMPMPNYDAMTVGEVLKAAKDMTDAERANLLAWEQGHRNRKQIVEPLVNWNS